MTKQRSSSAIPLSRGIFYFLLLACTPLVGVGYHFMQKARKWDAVSEKIATISHLSATKQKKQALNNRVRTVFESADHHYLTSALGQLTFLSKEQEALERLLANPAFTGNETAEKRFAHISGKENTLQFKELVAQTGEGIIETVETLTHPVEIDGEDLKIILRRIEGECRGKPQLIFTDFHLNKKTNAGGNEVFEVNLKLLKREFIS